MREYNGVDGRLEKIYDTNLLVGRAPSVTDVGPELLRDLRRQKRSWERGGERAQGGAWEDHLRRLQNVPRDGQQSHEGERSNI